MPDYDALFLNRIVENLESYLETNLNGTISALDGQISQVVSFDVPVEITTQFPALYVNPSESDIVQADDDAMLRQTHEVIIQIAVVDIDANLTRTLITKYVLAIDRALRNMTPADFLGAMSASVGAPVWEVTKHSYGVLLGDKTIFRRDAELTLTIQFWES